MHRAVQYPERNFNLRSGIRLSEENEHDSNRTSARRRIRTYLQDFDNHQLLSPLERYAFLVAAFDLPSAGKQFQSELHAGGTHYPHVSDDCFTASAHGWTANRPKTDPVFTSHRNGAYIDRAATLIRCWNFLLDHHRFRCGGNGFLGISS